METRDTYWMKLALEQAKVAQEKGEVPVGAILVKDHELLSEGYNQPITAHDPSAHAEMVAIREACQTVNNYRLVGTTLYVTLEPCIMCFGAMTHARIERVVFGAYDPKLGVFSQKLDVGEHPQLNHRIQWEGGVLEESCSALLKSFFQEKRKG